MSLNHEVVISLMFGVLCLAVLSSHKENIMVVRQENAKILNALNDPAYQHCRARNDVAAGL